LTHSFPSAFFLNSKILTCADIKIIRGIFWKSWAALIGKKWEYAYSATPPFGMAASLKESCDNYESHNVLGWEDIDVPAGKFKTLKMEYVRESTRCTYMPGATVTSKTFFWYSPEVKYFVKAKYDFQMERVVKDWDLNSFNLKK
jgi:hypothetical protein